MAGYTSGAYNRIGDHSKLINKTKAANKDVSSGGYVDTGGFSTAAGSNEARIQNAGRAATNFYSREGGRITNNAYEAAEQDRRMMLDKDRLKYADARSPQQLLQDRMGSEAYAFRKGVTGEQNAAADDIRSEAGGLLDDGLKKTRTGSNSRGLLYSGLRQAAEGDYRSKVAGTMAKNIASSNKSLSSQADGMDAIAAEAGLKGAQATAQAKAQLQQISDQTSLQNAQRMQQLTGAIGYGMGSYAGNREKAPAQPSSSGGQYDQDFYAAHGADPYTQYSMSRR